MPDLPEIASQPLENQKWERFALLVSQGSVGTTAYQTVYPDSAYDSCRSSAATLLALPSVSDRVAYLKRQSAGKTVLTKAETQEFLAELVRSKLAQLPEDSALIQAIKRKDGETVELKVPDKLRALELNAKLSGWLDTRPDNAGVVNIQLINLTLPQNGTKTGQQPLDSCPNPAIDVQAETLSPESDCK